MANTEHILLRILSQPRYLCVVRAAEEMAATRMGLDTDDADRVVLAVDEACANVIRHGYRGRDGAILPPARQRAYLERQGATYVMISGYGSESARELDALLGAYPGWLTMVKRWRGGRVLFQVNPGH